MSARSAGGRTAVRALAFAFAVALLPTVGGARPQVTLEDTLNLSSSGALASIHPGIAIATDPATNTGTVHVVWEEENPDFIASGVAHRFRTFNLLTGAWKGDWSPRTWIELVGQDPAIAARGDTVVATFVTPPWEEGAPTVLQFARWNAATGAWEGPWPLSWNGNETVTNYCKQPDIAIDALGRVIMAWVDESENGRPYWGLVKNEPSSNGELGPTGYILETDRTQSPRIAAGVEAGDAMWAAWSKSLPESAEDVIYRSTKLQGSEWAQTTQLNEGLHGRAPDLAVGGGGGVCTAWQEQVDGGAGQPDIYLDCNTPGRRGVNLSGTAADRSVEPSVVFGAPEVGAMVAWREQPQAPDASINFKPAEPAAAPIAIEGGKVSSPVIATSGGFVHAVWVKEDGANGDDVFYGRFPSVATVATATPTTPPTPKRPTATATATRPRQTPSASATRPVPSGTPSVEFTPTPNPSDTPPPTLGRIVGHAYLPWLTKRVAPGIDH